MATESYMVCDKCSHKELTTVPTVWLHVAPVLSAHSAAAFEALHPDIEERLAFIKNSDGGDFCSLRCMGEWALGRDLLKGLEAEDA
jgi:hypothetical protein